MRILKCKVFHNVTAAVTSLDSSESLPSESMSPLSAISPRVIPLSNPTDRVGGRGEAKAGERENWWID